MQLHPMRRWLPYIHHDDRIITTRRSSSTNCRRLDAMYAKKRPQTKSSDDDDEIEIDELGFSDDIKQLLREAKEKQVISDDDDQDEHSSNRLVMDGAEINDDYIGDDDNGENDDNDDDDDDSTAGVVTSIDDIEMDEDEDEAVAKDAGAQWKEDVEQIIRTVVSAQEAYLQKITWKGGRIEVIISANDDPDDPASPSLPVLQMCHRRLYEEFEKREADLAVVTRNEIIVASPGIGDVLRSDRDFMTFKGFTVSVTTTEVFKKKTTFEGTLVERTDDCVSISQKGRMIRIPRAIIAEARLPRSKYESTDTEMRKLR